MHCLTIWTRLYKVLIICQRCDIIQYLYHPSYVSWLFLNIVLSIQFFLFVIINEVILQINTDSNIMETP